MMLNADMAVASLDTSLAAPASVGHTPFEYKVPEHGVFVS